MSKIDRRSTAMSMTMAVLASLGIIDEGMRFYPRNEASKLLDDEQKEDEKSFLATLTGEPLKIWKRRIRKGLSKTELDFIRSELKEGT